MPTFRYRAISPSGEVHTGTMEATTEAEVILRLQRQGSMPMRAEPAMRTSWWGTLWNMEFGSGHRLRRYETAELVRELATMLSAGQDLDRAFRYLQEMAVNERVRSVTTRLHDIIRDGSPLADAMARYPRVFSRLDVAL